MTTRSVAVGTLPAAEAIATIAARLPLQLTATERLTFLHMASPEMIDVTQFGDVEPRFIQALGAPTVRLEFTTNAIPAFGTLDADTYLDVDVDLGGQRLRGRIRVHEWSYFINPDREFQVSVAGVADGPFECAVVEAALTGRRAIRVTGGSNG